MSIMPKNNIPRPFENSIFLKARILKKNQRKTCPTIGGSIKSVPIAIGIRVPY